MKHLSKLANNLLTSRAISVLGLSLYVRYIGKFIRSIFKIIQVGDLRPLDQAMGLIASRFSY